MHQPPPEPRHVEIPVQYGGEFGPDLADVARHTGMSEARVIELHSAAEYLVYFVGFSTCFPVPRRTAAGTRDPAAFGAAQTRAGRQRRDRRSAGRASIRWPRPAAGGSSDGPR